LTRKLTDGILSFQNANKAATNGKEGKEKDKVAEIPKPDDGSKTRLSRRGAGLAFNQLSSKFGARLLDVIPNMWQFMAGGLISAFQPGKLHSTSHLSCF
jgi:TATA-binding protein-associated factor